MPRTQFHECLSYDIQAWRKAASEYDSEVLLGMWRQWERNFPESDPEYNDTRWRWWRRVYKQELLGRGLL